MGPQFNRIDVLIRNNKDFSPCPLFSLLSFTPCEDTARRWYFVMQLDLTNTDSGSNKWVATITYIPVAPKVSTHSSI